MPSSIIRHRGIMHTSAARGERGFSLVELLIALTILAIGLLAIAHMQVISIQGSSAARRFSSATNLVQREIEDCKGPGPMLYVFGTDTYIHPVPEIFNITLANDTDALFSPSVDFNTDIDGFVYDTMKVYDRFDTSEPKCGPVAYPAKCNYDALDYVIYINIRNMPSRQDSINENYMDNEVTIKEMKIYALWTGDEGKTHHVSVRTLLGLKDSDFY